MNTVRANPLYGQGAARDLMLINRVIISKLFSEFSCVRGLYQSSSFRYRRRVPFRLEQKFRWRRMREERWNFPHSIMCVFERCGPDGVVREAGNIRRAADPRFQSGREIAEPLLRRLAQWPRREGFGYRLAVGRMRRRRAGGTGKDALACAEATVLLPNGDTVIVGISIGTFKLGLIGEPTFQGAVVKPTEKCAGPPVERTFPGNLPPLNGVSRQPQLRADLGRESRGASTRRYQIRACLICSLIRRKCLCIPSHIRHRARSTMAMNNSAPKFWLGLRDLRRQRLSARSKQSPGKLVDASVITKGKPPVYPPVAKVTGVTGKVEVRVVISEIGESR